MDKDTNDIKTVSELTNEVDDVLHNKDGDDKKEKYTETNETKTTLLDKIKTMIKTKKEASAKADDTSDDDTTDDKGSDKQGDNVPEAFVVAATEAGWSEQQIADFASDYTDEELLEHVQYIKESSETPAKEQDSSQEKDDKDEEKKDDNKDGDTKDGEKDLIIKELRDRITKLEDANEKNSEKEQSDILIKRATKATEILDKLSETFPIFGVFEKGKPNSLPRFPNGDIIPNSPQNKARNQVWHLAEKLTNAGEDFEVALSVAINAFKGANLEKSVKRNLIKSLKRSEKKLSAKHSSHDAVHKAKSGADVVKQVMDKYGNNKS